MALVICLLVGRGLDPGLSTHKPSSVPLGYTLLNSINFLTFFVLLARKIIPQMESHHNYVPSGITFSSFTWHMFTWCDNKQIVTS